MEEQPDKNGGLPQAALRARSTFRVYLEFAKKSFQKRMQYRLANIAGLGTNFFFAAIQIFVFSAFYAAQTEPQPLNLREVTTYICLGQSFLMTMPLWGKSEIANAIKDGSVALQLIKPVDFQGYWFADECGKAAYYVMMRALPTFVLGKVVFGMQIPLDAAILFPFIVSITMSILMGAAINIAVFGTTFWTLDATGISGFVFTLVTFFSGFLVPIALWPEWLARIASWLPFEGLVSLPFSIYLGKITGGAILIVLGKQLLWTLVFIALGRAVLQRGFSRLVVQGG
jgi:ABC-2 type transport system permease protein